MNLNSLLGVYPTIQQIKYDTNKHELNSTFFSNPKKKTGIRLTRGRIEYSFSLHIPHM